ncbi:lambda exonuclease family protein [Aeromicrobium sp. Leaf291]|uniref:lambda exonuclease family protein n=1 Tax=Aeromicrobium sp. Leaf291 TaxID=1736325 RepID=UPI00070104AF|nr:lambda exonuclease family protein [Aeromicrobium sp. Leaf291]KQP83768.1 hypothetical protein ASF35_01955 [Aeromicrobium sp. Leaf291]
MTLTIHREMLQGSDEWRAARRGLLTASTIASVLTTKPPAPLDYACPQCNAEPGEDCISLARKTPAPIKKPHDPRANLAAENPDGLPDRITLADSTTIRAVALKLATERATSWEDPDLYGFDIDRGHQVEPIARAWYADDRKVAVEQVGLMVLDLDGARLGYSPDGLVGDDGCIEIKGPRGKRHLLTHIEGAIPADHMPQVQTGMFVAGRSWCDFISYLGGEPPFVIRVHADPAWFGAIESAVHAVEAKTFEFVNAYRAATNGLAPTATLPDPYDVELKLA